MTNTQMIKKIEYLKELEEFMEEVKAEADTIKDSLKAEMERYNVEELEVGAYIIRWTSILSNRFDTTSFKKAYSEIYKNYTKQVASRRFSISY